MQIAITPGEPAGIGPDIVLKLALKELPCCPVVISDPDLLRARVKLLNLPVTINLYKAGNIYDTHKPGQVLVYPVMPCRDVIAGQLQTANVEHVLDSLNVAIELCLNKTFAALVTGPVHKSVINEAGVSFTGHTEYLGKLTGTQPVMMLVNDKFKVALVTTHLPLANVSEHITRETVGHTMSVVYNDLQNRFAVAKPRVLVSGLNPHAGENGHLGREELEIIKPVIDDFVKRGFDFIGPLPADTLFISDLAVKCDAVIAMYHDQGLPVIKYAGFGQTVNITLGLPMIRTSVDHGTALELAASGKADESSLEAAFNKAFSLASI